jgi:hypothetical protein
LPGKSLPLGMDYEQGEIPIEFGLPTEPRDWEGGAARTGFVADDMYDFINDLKPFVEWEKARE